MKSLEIIKIRTGHQNLKGMMLDLNESIAEASSRIKGGHIKLFSNQGVESDLMICIFWDQPPLESRGSTIGLEIRNFLESSGLINHSTWVEQKVKKMISK